MDMLQKSSTPAKVAPKETKRPKGKPPKTTPSPSVKGKSAADLEAKWQTEEDLKRQKEKVCSLSYLLCLCFYQWDKCSLFP